MPAKRGSHKSQFFVSFTGEGIQNSTCTHSIPHGKITWWCGVGDSCPYSCNEGYLDHEKVSWVRCNSAGKWEDDWFSSGVTEDELCTRKILKSYVGYSTYVGLFI